MIWCAAATAADAQAATCSVRGVTGTKVGVAVRGGSACGPPPVSVVSKDAGEAHAGMTSITGISKVRETLMGTVLHARHGDRLRGDRWRKEFEGRSWYERREDFDPSWTSPIACHNVVKR